MRFVHLHLRAYGPFTDRTISFKNDSIQSGLHLLLGPNEAGKSSALRAIRAVLFGMDSRDAHRHVPDMLRVGLKLQTADGQVLDVERRRKGGSKSLLFTESNMAVPVEAWARVLPVDDADLFEQMFAVTYDRLVDGGRQLAEFKGDIGKTLLAASGDLAHTVARMGQLQQLSEEIYAPQASSRKLNRALKEYKDSDRQIREERFTSREYTTAVARLKELDEEIIVLSSRLEELANQERQLTRFHAAAPHIDRLTADQQLLNAMSNVILLYGDFEQRFHQYTSDQHISVSRKAEAESETRRLNAELETIARNPVVAGLIDELETLKKQFGQIQGFRDDLPKRRARHQDLLIQRQRLCTDLRLTPDALPRVSVEQRKRIASLSEKFIALQAKSKELPDRVSSLQTQIRKYELELSDLPASIDTADIAEALKQAPQRELADSLRKEYDALAARLARDVAGLPLWQGTLEQLETLRVPLAASVNEIERKFILQQSREEQLSKDRRAIAHQLENCQRELKRLDKSGPIPTEQDLMEARAQRDLGWTAIKKRLLSSAEDGAAEMKFLSSSKSSLTVAFEQALNNADAIADQLRQEADRVEQKRSAVENQARITQQWIEHEKAEEAAGAGRAQLESQWKTLWAGSGLQPGSPEEMKEWLQKRTDLINASQDLKRLAIQWTAASEEESHAREGLALALGTTSAQALTILVAKAEKRISDAETIERKRHELVTAKRHTQVDLERVVKEQQDNRSALLEWTDAWKAAVRELPVNEASEPEHVQEVLQRIGEIAKYSDEIAELEHRIHAMQEGEAQYTEAIRKLALRAGREDLATKDPLLALGDLHTLARTAYDNELAARSIAENLARKQKELFTATVDCERHTAALEELRNEAGVAGVHLLPEAVARSKRKATVTANISEHLKALAASSGKLPLDTFMAQAQAAIEGGDLAARIDECRHIREKLDQEKLAKIRERDDLDRRFKLRESATAVNKAACDKYAAAARIEALAGEYLERQMGVKLLARAIEIYRAKHQDPLLQRAGEYFRSLTCGAFVGLTIDHDTNSRVLKGVRAGGATLDVTGMSDGTRDQLFLALRLAYIENHCMNNSPCPVILDDVLMAFDDKRAAATLKALQELSYKTQLLVFTHHAHHVQLAQDALGTTGFHLHELGRTVGSGVV